MPIEQGIVLLIQSGLGSPPLAPGGWAGELPQNIISPTTGTTMAWAYKTITREPTYALSVQDGFMMLAMQIDCHGTTAALAQQLAYAIRGILRGEFSGTLSDSDATVVQGIFDRGTDILGFHDATRSYVCTLEWDIAYQQDT